MVDRRLQQELFVPFIDLLELSLEETTTDYRVLKAATNAANVYAYPITPNTGAAFDSEVMTSCCRQKRYNLRDDARLLVHIQEAALDAGTCRFLFSGLCEKPLGAVDYLAIAGAFSVVFVSDIPLFTEERLNRRCVDFLHCLAMESPEHLYKVEAGMKAHIDEVFAFYRTVSRLLEIALFFFMSPDIR
ncbi:hypothetical protein PsorP6_017285 [Peronosclerospora sorghi]|uniref:Uncharacterized protein n=1 Tax=Peronosclerospora sorghi TaxID=230839 RepID=A0ACC0WPT6_9STRA|nr:hypothetical protein PsorP6_017285 [Peronosclerospora sorghi]